MLTRKYYRMIARVIKNNKEIIYGRNSTRKIIKMESLINELCDEFHNDNSYFDKDKFMEACK